MFSVISSNWNRVDGTVRMLWLRFSFGNDRNKNGVHKTQFIQFEHLVVCECDFSSCIIIRQCFWVCWFTFFLLLVSLPTNPGRCVQPKCWLHHEPGPHFHLLMHIRRQRARARSHALVECMQCKRCELFHFGPCLLVGSDSKAFFFLLNFRNILR